MRKIFTLIVSIGVLSGFTTMAQTEIEGPVKLVRQSSDYGVVYTYEYTESDKISEVYEKSAMDDLRREFEYYESGCIKKETVNQYYQSTVWIVANYSEYEEDEQGRVASRTGYNLSLTDNDYRKASVMTYGYNEEGLLSKIDVYLSINWDVPYQTYNYVYDEAGRLVSEYWDSYDDSSGETFVEYKTEYKYDEDGRRVEDLYYSANMLTHELSLYRTWDYVYDNAGNVSLIEKYDETMTAVEEVEFTWYDYEGEIVYPYNYNPMDENENEIFDLCRRPIETRTLYEYNPRTGGLELSDIYSYTYDPAPESAVRELNSSFRDVEKIEVSAVDGKLNLRGVPFNTRVEIYAGDGRLVKCFKNLGTDIDISALSSGVYIVSTPGGSTRFIK